MSETSNNPKTIEYCLGVVYNPMTETICMVEKGSNSPSLIQGKWNGFGGKVSSGEIPIEAMDREWKEESGCQRKLQWKYIGAMTCKHKSFLIHVFGAEFQGQVNSNTDVGERIRWHLIEKLTGTPEIFANNFTVLIMHYLYGQGMINLQF